METHRKSRLTKNPAGRSLPVGAGELLAAISDPTRRAIFERLRESPQPVVDLARGLPISRPAVSQHLKVLKDVGLVRDRQEANRRIYSLDPAGLAPLMAYLEDFWKIALESYAAESRAAGSDNLVVPETSIPPVQQSVEVPLEPAAAFELFTTGIARWWPIETHFSRGPVQTLIFEGRDGGDLKEVCTDGVVVTYGRVLAWEPPSRVVISWFVAPELGPPTEVEVRFTATEAGCRVDLEHRAFEGHGEARGRKERDSYANGWPGVLELFARRASSEIGVS